MSKKIKIKPEQLSKAEIVQFLSNLDDEDFICVFQALFEIKCPHLEPDTFSRDKYFLGRASRQLESEEGGAEYWGPWKTEAVGYANAELYADGRVPNGRPEQAGPCTRCHTNIRASAKNALCPICGAKLYLT